MKIFRAIGKYFLRTASDNKHNRDIQKAKNSAFAETGYAMNNARRHGKYINGKKVYRAKFSSKKRKLEQQKARRDKFIDDL